MGLKKALNSPLQLDTYYHNPFSLHSLLVTSKLGEVQEVPLPQKNADAWLGRGLSSLFTVIYEPEKW